MTQTKKWHDMSPAELYQLEREYEEHMARAEHAINVLRDHMKKRGMQLKPLYYGF
jgi:hypothetical protein